MDYRDHKPHLNAPLFRWVASGVGLRQTARSVGLSPRCAEEKFRKIGRHLWRLNLNLRKPLEEGSFQLDEFETYEGRRNTRPLSVPVLIEAESRFVVWAEAATIRPRGKMTPAREKAIEEDEGRFGRRVDQSRRALRRTLRRAAQMASGLKRLRLHTDEKSSYPRLAAEAFGAARLEHTTTHSEVVRGTWNPLFPINHTEAMLRDLLGRLRRESWLVSKKRRYLNLALQYFCAYRNYVRRRFNRDSASPAQLLGITRRRLLPTELLSWRQDWGARSPRLVGSGTVSVQRL
jgi:hypothetical protein